MNPIIPLEEIRIAKPCRADWNTMTGDQRARFCGSCHKNVYDISQMTRAQAQALIVEKEGNLCLRLHRRSDGTVITSDCPIGQTSSARPPWWNFIALIALLSAGLTGCNASRKTVETETLNVAAARVPIAVVPTPTPIVVIAPTLELPVTEQVSITNVRPGDSIAHVDMGVPLPMPNAE